MYSDISDARTIICCLSTNATPLGGLDENDLDNVIKNIKLSNTNVIPLLADYGTLLKLPIYQKICEKHNVDYLLGTRISYTNSSNQLSELTLIAKNANGVRDLGKLLSDVNKKYKSSSVYGDSENSLPKWDYKTIDIDSLSFLSEDILIISNNENLLADEFKDIINPDNICFDARVPENNTSNPRIPIEKVYYLDNDSKDVHNAMLEKLDNKPPQWEFITNSNQLHSFSSFVNLNAANKTNSTETHEFINNFLNVKINRPEKLPAFKSDIDLTIDSRVKLNELLINNPELDRKKFEAYLDNEINVLKRIDGFGYFEILIGFKSWLDKKNKNNEEQVLLRGRGSAAASLILYLYGVTTSIVDPIRFELDLDRFIQVAKIELSDVDLDISSKHRPLFATYIEEVMHGSSAASFVVESKNKSTKELIKKVTKLLPKKYTKQESYYLDLLSNINSLKFKQLTTEELQIDNILMKLSEFNGIENIDNNLKELLDDCRIYSNKSISYKTHPSGYLSVNENDALVSSVFTKSGGRVLEVQKPADLGLVKFDILSSNPVDQLSQYASLIKKYQKDEYVPVSIDQCDHNFFKFFINNTVGVTQMSGLSMQKVLNKFKPNSLDELLVCMAVPRPILSKEDRFEFFKRRANNGKLPSNNLYNHPEITAILNVSCGYILFDEQIMGLCKRVIGLDALNTEKVRLAIKKGNKVKFEELKPIILDASHKNGVELSLANQLINLMANSIGKYSFPKGHAALYGAIAIEQVYAKYTQPVMAFESICMSNDFMDKKHPSGIGTQFEALCDEYIARGYTINAPLLSRSAISSYICDQGMNIYLPLDIVHKRYGYNVNEAFKNIYKFYLKSDSKNHTLKNFIDISHQSFISQMKSKNSDMSLREIQAIFKNNIEAIIYLGYFDDTGFVKKQTISDNRLQTREQLLSYASGYLESLLSPIEYNSYSMQEITLEAIELSKIEKSVYKKVMFDAPLVNPQFEFNDSLNNKKHSLKRSI